MPTVSTALSLETPKRGIYDLTQKVQRVVLESGVGSGLCNVFVHHTSASLLVAENADPEVRRDLERFMSRLVPDGDSLFRHTSEGDDDMPAHVRTVLTQTSITFPVSDGQLVLGQWQGIFLWEHRKSSHQRSFTVTVSGDGREPGR